MKRKLVVSLLFAYLFLFSNVVFAEKEERSLPSFSKIALRISANVYVEQGKKQEVRVEAQSSIIKDVITEVNGRTLIIRFPAKFLFRNFNTGKINVYVTMPEIDGLTLSGSGDIYVDKLETRILDLLVSGSGSLKIDNLSAERISAAISGSGGVNIYDGEKADELKISLSGSGDINALGIEAEEVRATIAGSGNSLVKSNGSLTARIVGSGNIFYEGNPYIESSIVGSGTVKKK
ncbi:MAG: hypothetical protein CSA36_08420 [Draconibacterium sp.]|nr:MAG: hypothetical protein CSA36_08420 [Draconibacterium sp.]